MSPRAVPVSTEDLRQAAQDVAKTLCVSDVGGACYHGGQHTCFTRQGRRPLPLYKVEEMCERCAASWHAVMAASLLDSVIIGQQFMGTMPNAISQEFLHEPDNGASVRGKAVRAHTGRRPSAAPKAREVTEKPKLPPCEKCGKEFTQQNHLTMHERHCKGDQKPKSAKRSKK